MPFVSDARPWVQKAFKENFAIVSFNVCNVEMVKGCLLGAEREGAPLMLQTSPVELRVGSPLLFGAMVRELASASPVPVMLHLDHGDSFGRVGQALRGGYSSLMFDGEEFPIEENVSKTAILAEIVHGAGAALEAAAGSFGEGEGIAGDVSLTDPEEAHRLWYEGNADMVACSVGSRHGESSRLDLPSLERIFRKSKKPIAMHGGSGINSDDIGEAVRLGVTKLNIGMALIRSILDTWRTLSSDAAWHVDVMEAATERIAEIVQDKLRVAKANGRAK